MRYFDCPEGWERLAHPFLSEASRQGVAITGIKEKFGIMRVNWCGEPDEYLRELIQQAEDKSASACQDCGLDAEPTTDGQWLLTLCLPCKASRGRA